MLLANLITSETFPCPFPNPGSSSPCSRFLLQGPTLITSFLIFTPHHKFHHPLIVLLPSSVRELMEVMQVWKNVPKPKWSPDHTPFLKYIDRLTENWNIIESHCSDIHSGDCAGHTKGGGTSIDHALNGIDVRWTVGVARHLILETAIKRSLRAQSV